MSGKDKDTFNKLKQFFRISKTPGLFFKKLIIIVNYLINCVFIKGTIKERTDFVLTVELERELRPETPVAQRCKALKELGDAVLNNRLEVVRYF